MYPRYKTVQSWHKHGTSANFLELVDQVEKCAAGKACQDGECRDVVCKAMQTRCFDSSVVERCLDSGTGWVATRCESFEICLESKCQQVICDPDEIRCSPNFKDIEKCNEFGTKWISVST